MPQTAPHGEHPELAEHDKWDPVPLDQREPLDDPTILRQRREDFLDACLGDRETAGVIEVLSE